MTAIINSIVLGIAIIMGCFGVGIVVFILYHELSECFSVIKNRDK